MAAAETARLIASLELQDKNFTRGIRNVERGVNRVDRKLGAFSGFVNRNMARAIDSIGVHLVSSVGQGLEELATLEDATTSVTGAINQMGLTGKVSADQIATWANEIEGATDAAFDDKAIVQATATLIRYGKVTEKNIRPSMEIITDLAARTGDVESAAVLLGKALSNPAKAAGKLARQGIYLTKAQEKQLKAMVKVNDMAGAQNLLLDILSDTTKGAAKASGGPYRDALNKLGDAGEDLRRSFAVGLLPVIEEVSTMLTTELAKPETLETLKGIGSALADTLKAIIGAAKQLPWKEIGTSLQIAGTAAKTILDAFLGMPPWVQAAVISGWGLNKITGGLIGDLASGLIKGVLGINAGIVNVNGPVAGGPGGAAGAAGGAAKGGFLNRFIGAGGALRMVGSVAIIGAALVLWQKVADDFGKLQQFVEEGQTKINERIGEIAPTLTSDDAVRNLKAVVSGVNKQNDLQKVLTAVITGGELTADFEVAANAIRKDQTLSRQEIVAALDALSSAKLLSDGVLDTPGLDAAIKDLTARLGKTASADPKDTSRVTRPDPGKAGVAGIAPAIKPLTAKVAATNVALSGIKTGIATTSAAEKAELGNVKNAVATMDTNARANALAVVTSQAASRVLATIQAGTQAIKTSATTTAVNNTRTAVGGVAPAITPAIYAIGSQISSAIWAARPVIQSTNVVNNYTRTERYGASGDSRMRAGGRTG